MTRPVNDAGLDLVRTFEGLRTEAYRCPAGVWTIGYGHTGDVQPGQSITAKQAEKILRDDLAACGEQVEDLIGVPLSDCQYAALVSFVFNAGAGALRSSTLRRRLNAGDYDCVPSELAKWVKATDPNTGRKVSLAGLVRRRAAEGELWLRDAADDAFRASPDMPQRVRGRRAARRQSRQCARRSCVCAAGRGWSTRYCACCRWARKCSSSAKSTAGPRSIWKATAPSTASCRRPSWRPATV